MLDMLDLCAEQQLLFGSGHYNNDAKPFTVDTKAQSSPFEVSYGMPLVAVDTDLLPTCFLQRGILRGGGEHHPTAHRQLHRRAAIPHCQF